MLFIDQNTGFRLLSFRENINRKTVAKIFFQTKRSTFLYQGLSLLKAQCIKILEILEKTLFIVLAKYRFQTITKKL